MKIESQFDEGDVIEFADFSMGEMQKRYIKILYIESWGSFNGFRYRCIETDKDGNVIASAESKIYDDEEFRLMPFASKVTKAKGTKKDDKKMFSQFEEFKAFCDILSGLSNNNGGGKK